MGAAADLITSVRIVHIVCILSHDQLTAGYDLVHNRTPVWPNWTPVGPSWTQINPSRTTFVAQSEPVRPYWTSLQMNRRQDGWVKDVCAAWAGRLGNSIGRQDVNIIDTVIWQVILQADETPAIGTECCRTADNRCITARPHHTDTPTATSTTTCQLQHRSPGFPVPDRSGTGLPGGGLSAHRRCQRSLTSICRYSDLCHAPHI